jgi:membrane protein implicated in regulation of membrane protease activity
MLIVALVLAVIGLAALVTAVVTSNELIAWVCIAASVIGVLLLIVDAVRERSHDEDGADGDGDDVAHADDATTVMEPVEPAEDYPEESVTEVSEPVGVSNDKTDDGAADPAKND